MTYGWAILIIVIVAVILYSMGIFNPSSSVTFTSSGFSPFIIKSAFCNNIGLKVAIQAGPLPNLATSVQVTKVYITSTSGGTISKSEYNLSSPITLTSGSTATTIIPAAVCNTVNTKYSFSAALTYSYSTAAGNVVTNTTGTVAGTSIAGKPSALTNYIPVTITNTQSTSTPQPFQQMVNASSSVYSSYAASNLQNVEFFYYNGTVIPSWLAQYNSSYAIWWLKVESIPSGSSITVYMGFAPTSTNLFNTVNDGEAPQLSSTYAEYDDGYNIFPFYSNFHGTSLNTSKFSIGMPGGSSPTQLGTYSVNNGLTIKVNSTQSIGVITSKQYNGYNSYFGFGIAPPTWNKGVNFAIVGSNGLIAVSPALYFQDGLFLVANDNGQSNQTQVDNTGALNNYLLVYNDYFIYAWFNYSHEIYLTTNAYSYVNPRILGILNSYKGNETFGPIYYYFLTAPLPPNGVIPTVSFGSIA